MTLLNNILCRCLWGFILHSVAFRIVQNISDEIIACLYYNFRAADLLLKCIKKCPSSAIDAAGLRKEVNDLENAHKSC